jgi:hypothetical protein
MAFGGKTTMGKVQDSVWGQSDDGRGVGQCLEVKRRWGRML